MKIKQRGSTTTILLVFMILILLGIIIYSSLKDKKQIEEKDIPDEVGQIQVIDNSTSTVSTSTASSDKIVSKTTIEKATGIIKSVYTKNNKNYVDIDYIDYGKCIDSYDCPNGVKIVNNNPLIRTFELSQNVVVNIQDVVIDTRGKTGTLNNIEYSGLVKIFKDKNDYRNSNLWDITIKNNIVTELVENFRP